MTVRLLCERFGIDGAVRDAAVRAYERVRDVRYETQALVKANVLAAFLDEGVDESDLAGSTGYGYDDAARERYESLLARVFGCERVLARLSFVSGTHAIVSALAACVPPGKTLLSITGPPYDTLRNAVTQAPHNLVDGGIRYREADWLTRLDGLGGPSTKPCAEESKHQDDEVWAELQDTDIAAVFVQRSR